MFERLRVRRCSYQRSFSSGSSTPDRVIWPIGSSTIVPVHYLDHAASTPVLPEAIEAMLPFLADHPGNPSGGHRAAQEAKTALEEARENIAALLGCRAAEIVFTGSGTEADNLAVKGSARARRHLGDGVVTTAFEHKGVLASAHRLASEGFRIYEAAVTSGGIIDLDQLADLLDERTVVVSVMLVNNEVGTVQPLDKVTAVVRERAPNACLHTDAVQAVPWIDVATATLGCDLVAISGHKFGGPKGMGVLIVRDGTDLRPDIEGGGQERGLRSGTVNVAGAIALATALRITQERRGGELIRIAALRDRLWDGIHVALPETRVNGDVAAKVAGNLHVCFPGIEAEVLLLMLDQRGIAAAAGSSCSSGATEPSYVLKAMGMSREDALASVRFSLGVASTDADVDACIAIVPELVRGLRERTVVNA